MNPRRVLLPLLVVAAGAAPAAGFLGEGPGAAALLLPAAVFAGAAFQGLRRGFLHLPRAGRRRLQVFLHLIVGVAFLGGLLAGSRHAPFLAALLPIGLRGLRGPRASREMRTLRDALAVSMAYLAFEGSAPALMGASTVALLLAVLLPVMHGARAARAAREAGGVPVLPSRAGGLRTALWAVPVTALLAAFLYVVLPRTSPRAAEEPAALAHRDRSREGGGVPDTGGSATAIPARSVALGDIGRLLQDRRPLLEVTVFRGGRPAQAEEFGPLLRSGFLETFDGTAWSAPPTALRKFEDAADGNPDGWIALPRRRPPAPPQGETLEQRVKFLAGGSDALFAIGVPLATGGSGVAGGVLASARGDLRAAAMIGEGEEVRVRSVASAGSFALLDDEVLSRARQSSLLEIPAGHDLAAATARQVLNGITPGTPTLRALETWLAARCSYSLDLPTEIVGTPVEEFLFRSRRGHCELFASSAAVMLRAAGIPARLAIGFRGGEWRAAERRYSFRGADAHAWVEAWFEDRGWVTFDPTPAADGAPDRERPEDDGAAGRAGGGWFDGILRFDGAAQVRLLAAAAEGTRRVLRRALFAEESGLRWGGLLATALALALLGAALLLRNRARPAPGPAAPPPVAPPPPPEAWALLLGRLTAAGCPRRPAETAREFADRAAALGFRPGTALERLSTAFEEERWGGRRPEGSERALLLDMASSVGRQEPSA